MSYSPHAVASSICQHLYQFINLVLQHAGRNKEEATLRSRLVPFVVHLSIAAEREEAEQTLPNVELLKLV
jgi:hypothetical protein